MSLFTFYTDGVKLKRELKLMIYKTQSGINLLNCTKCHQQMECERSPRVFFKVHIKSIWLLITITSTHACTNTITVLWYQ